MNFHGLRGSGVIMFQDSKERLAARIEAFSRFQVGFLSSEDFHRILEICIDSFGFSYISWIFVDRVHNVPRR